jgi:hypothetical protein
MLRRISIRYKGPNSFTHRHTHLVSSERRRCVASTTVGAENILLAGRSPYGGQDIGDGDGRTGALQPEHRKIDFVMRSPLISRRFSAPPKSACLP